MKTFMKTALAGAIAMTLASPLAAKDIKLKMATNAPGTSPYLAMTTMATIVNQALPDVNIQVDATGAATKHMIEVAQGKLDMSMTAPIIYKFLKNGSVMYKKLPNAAELAENLRLLYWFPLGQFHYVVYADSDIKTPADIKGKKVFLGPPGGGAYNASARIMKFMAGYEAGKDYEPVNASWASALQGFQDRQFDVYTAAGIAPFPQLEQLSLTSKLRIIGLTKDEFNANEGMRAYINEHVGEEIGIIKAGIYGDGVVNKEDTYTLAGLVGITARADLDEDTVYRITKAYWEGAKEAMKTQPWLNSITLEGGVIDGGMKLHPGALRYYDEIGLEIPAGSR
ncbi:MAG: TAXI family TRAP transporter solute-binding subunit [Rhizobiaceae bacterium]|nr:TAXI family TRAP transporter solute-binding subunit [Rhizobiaceae bacterium]